MFTAPFPFQLCRQYGAVLGDPGGTRNTGAVTLDVGNCGVLRAQPVVHVAVDSVFLVAAAGVHGTNATGWFPCRVQSVTSKQSSVPAAVVVDSWPRLLSKVHLIA